MTVARADARFVRMWNGIARKVSVARRLDGRLNTMHLLPVAPGPQSEVEWQDHPDVQVLLLRRDRLLAVRENIRTAESIAVHGGDLEQRVRAMEAISRLRTAEDRELTAISDKLDTLRAESNRHWALVAKMVTDVAKLRQANAHFNKRLVADERASSGLTEAERGVIEAADPTKEDDDL